MTSPRPKIAFQGIQGSYSDVACQHFSAENALVAQAETVGFDTFQGVVQAVLNDECQYCLIPIENSATGTYLFNYDLITNNNLFIVGEYCSHEQHCLLALPGTRLEDIKEIRSHPYAIDQCRDYLGQLGKHMTITQAADTAGSAKDIAIGQLKNVAAIAGNRAADIYNLAVLKQDIEDSKNIITRYFLLSKSAYSPERHLSPKSSISVLLKNQQGAFFKALSCFALRGINITKLESRPSNRSITLTKPWEYILYIDFEGSLSDVDVKNALVNLEEFAKVRILGSYARFAGDTPSVSPWAQGFN